MPVMTTAVKLSRVGSSPMRLFRHSSSSLTCELSPICHTHKRTPSHTHSTLTDTQARALPCGREDGEPAGSGVKVMAPTGSGDTLTGSPRAHAAGQHGWSKYVWFQCDHTQTHRPHAVSSLHTLLDAKQNRIMRCAHCPVSSQLLHAPCPALQSDLAMIRALQWTAPLSCSSIPGRSSQPELIVTCRSGVRAGTGVKSTGTGRGE